eukprot:TRINITY_DN24291_c0_g1_i1.p1 TRINITY_DN24291_c0_g1~~TRINITY_DN24291_c0_g1_i1.p1  ORF type:complete len:361 (+),score=68.24 TRINITY_DN24291_c0_g1_i1:50-1084(+)
MAELTAAGAAARGGRGSGYDVPGRTGDVEAGSGSGSANEPARIDGDLPKPDGPPASLPEPVPIEHFGNEAESKLKRTRSRSRFNYVQMVGLVLIPSVIFFFVCFMFANWFWKMPMLVVFVVLLIGFVPLAIGVVPQMRRAATWHFWVSVLAVIAVVCSATVGLATYFAQLRSYWQYKESFSYTNVPPSDPSQAYMDAGKIIFADDARVDSSRSVGYKDVKVYCVAPIIDDTVYEDSVQFWAVGMDCCEARGKFSCDDAWDVRARSALVVTNVEKYPEAIKQAEAAYGLRSAENPLFVRWVVDPWVVQQLYWHMGVGVLMVGLGFNCVCNSLVVCFLNKGFSGLL